MKPYLVFISNKGELQNLEEMIKPLKRHIRGICALLHECDEHSEESIFLNKINTSLGAGKIIYGEYVNNHAHSRNRVLKETNIEEGDVLVCLDSLERIAPPFLKKLQFWTERLENGLVDIIRFNNKPFLVRYREDMVYVGTPHEFIMVSSEPKLKGIEIKSFESQVRIDLRKEKRPNEYYIANNIRYLLQPNSNQNFIEMENYRTQKSFEELEVFRKDLLFALKDSKLPRTVEGVKELLSKPLTEKLKSIINNIVQVNIFYRYYILKEELPQDYNFENMKKIE